MTIFTENKARGIFNYSCYSGNYYLGLNSKYNGKQTDDFAERVMG